MSANDILKLTPLEIYEFITAALSCKQVPYIAGPPAIGKSRIVYQVAEDANALVIDKRLSQMLSEDMTGLPERNASKTKAVYLPFEEFPMEGDPLPDGYSGWFLFLDELSSASEEVLAAAYSIILDHMVGGKKLHPKCMVIAAGNRASDSAIARELPDTLITRMLPVEMKVSHKDWLAWAESQPAHKKNEAVIDFIRKNPNMLYAPTKQKDRDELETYATPRGWEKVFAHINLHERSQKRTEAVDAAGVPTGQMTQGKPISEMVFHLMAAAVGPMAARSFREDYDEQIQLPYPWEVAQSPSSTRIPSNGVAKAKMMVDLAEYFIESDSQTRDNVMIYINRVGGENSELFASEIKKRLGSTPSDQRLMTQIQQRLNLDPLLGAKSTVKGGLESLADDSSPF